jgi:2-keto-3-deoxy-L-rhamnonate aldolase RhmA
VPSFTDGVPEGETIFDSWNKAAVIVQVESKLGCDNVAELAAVPGGESLLFPG